MDEALGIFVREVFTWLKKPARDNGVLKGKCGSVTFVQRLGSAARAIRFESTVESRVRRDCTKTCGRA
jgi:hypothetical protein